MSNLPGGVWEDVSCPLCTAGTPAEGFLSCGDRLKEPKLRNYSLISCNGCGLIFLSPRPPLELTPSHHLQEDYDPFISFSKKRRLAERLYITARNWAGGWKRRLVLRLVRKGSRVLDVGCGTGEFLAAIQKTMITTGLEPEPVAGEWGRRHYDLDIRTGTLESVALPAESFDLITLWHALEHIPEPLEAIRQIRTLLAAHGKALIALPNISSFDAGFYHCEWVALDAPRHLWHFTPKTIEILADRAGLKCIASGILPLDHFYNVLLSEGIHLKSSPQHRVWSPFRMGYALTGSLVKAVVAGNGSGMYYILQK